MFTTVLFTADQLKAVDNLIKEMDLSQSAE